MNVKQIKMELVLNTYGISLGRDNEGFVISTGDGRQRIPAEGISSIHISQGAQISSDAVMLAVERENDPTAFFDMVREQTRQADNGNAPLQEKHSPDPAEPVLEKIKAMLNPKMAKAAKSREVFVPEELKIIMSGLQCYIEDAGLVLDETVNIQYGKKLRMSLGLRQAEVNVFYGRRGFSVVVSPRSGTDKELNEVAANLIRAYIDDIT